MIAFVWVLFSRNKKVYVHIIWSKLFHESPPLNINVTFFAPRNLYFIHDSRQNKEACHLFLALAKNVLKATVLGSFVRLRHK